MTKILLVNIAAVLSVFIDTLGSTHGRASTSSPDFAATLAGKRALASLRIVNLGKARVLPARPQYTGAEGAGRMSGRYFPSAAGLSSGLGLVR
jgi:hypothetical protein